MSDDSFELFFLASLGREDSSSELGSGGGVAPVVTPERHRTRNTGDNMAKLLQRVKRGFTLVELMIVVAIIGVLAALAIYGVRKYIANAKTAEARMAVGRIAKDASAAYNKENMGVSVLALGSVTSLSNALCGSASHTVPSGPGSIAGKKYQSSPAEWDGDQSNGWACLHFSMQDPQYFMYNYTAGSSSFLAIANGNLNGDNSLSTFRLAGAVQTAPTGGSVVTIAPSIEEINPED
jgi:type IV pilus assembly protein PilA